MILDIREPLGNQLVRGEAIEQKAPLLGVPEILVVGRVAKHASSYDVIRVVSDDVTLGQQVVPRQRQPVAKRQRTVQAAIAALEPVPLVNGKSITPQGIIERRHRPLLPSTFGLSFLPEDYIFRSGGMASTDFVVALTQLFKVFIGTAERDRTR